MWRQGVCLRRPSKTSGYLRCFNRFDALASHLKFDWKRAKGFRLEALVKRIALTANGGHEPPAQFRRI